METTDTRADKGSACISTIHQLQKSDISDMYIEVLTEVSTFIVMADDPSLEIEKQLHWLKSIAMLKADISALSWC